MDGDSKSRGFSIAAVLRTAYVSSANNGSAVPPFFLHELSTNTAQSTHVHPFLNILGPEIPLNPSTGGVEVSRYKTNQDRDHRASLGTVGEGLWASVLECSSLAEHLSCSPRAFRAPRLSSSATDSIARCIFNILATTRPRTTAKFGTGRSPSVRFSASQGIIGVLFVSANWRRMRRASQNICFEAGVFQRFEAGIWWLGGKY
jgi:hypothetical protein